MAMTVRNFWQKRRTRNSDRYPSRGKRSLHQLAQGFERLEGRLLLAVDWVAQGPSPSQNGQVESITNKEVIGSIHTVLAHPTNPDILYIGATNGGVWKTQNATVSSPSWTPLTDTMPSLSIGALAFDPTDSSRQTIVAGIGKYSSYGRQGGSRSGLLRTTDGGTSWSVINGGGTLVGKNISGIAARGPTIVVSVNTADSFSTTNTGIFRSTDGGTTFTRISTGGTTGLPAGWSYDLTEDPTNNAVLYTSIVSSSTGNGVYKSADTGATWTKVSSAAIDAFITTNVSNLEITVGKQNNVFIGIVQNGNPVGFFRSGDGGGSWTQMDAPKTNENGTNVGLNPEGGDGPGPGATAEEIAGGQGSIHFSIIADPDNPNVVYVGGDRQPTSNGDKGSFPNSIGAKDYSGRLFRGDSTRAAGSQWVHLTHSNTLGAAGGGTAKSSSPHADSRDMTFDAAGNIIEVDDGGVYRRTSPKNNTGDWFSLNGNLRVTEMHDVAYDPIANILMSGNQDTGTTEQIATGGAAWRSVSTGDGGDVAVDSVTLAANGQSIRYSSYQNLYGFQRRVVNAANTVVSTSFPSLAVTGGGAALTPQFKTPVELNAVTPSRMIIVGSNSIYESSDQGSTLVEIGPGMGPKGASWDQDAVAAGGFRNGVPNAEALYVGVGDKLRIRTAAGGSLIQSDPNPSSSSTIRDVVMSALDWGTAFAIDDSRVYRTGDAGGSWTDVTGNLGAIAGGFIRSIEYIPGTVGAIVVGGSLGVFRSLTSALGTWTEVGTALPNVPVWDLYYDKMDDLLVAGTLGRGAWTVSQASDLANDTNLPALSVSNVTVGEGNSGTTSAAVTVSLSAATTATVTVSYSTADGTAKLADDDYVAASGTLTFEPGETKKTIVLQIKGDTRVEPDESFVIRLSNAVAATLAKTEGTVTITNDDVVPSLAIAATDAVKPEGNSGTTPFTFTIARAGSTTGTSTAAWAVTGNGSRPASPNDFAGGLFPSGTVAFAPGEATKTVTVYVAGDTTLETDEGFAVTISSPDTAVSTKSAVGTIRDDDAPAVLVVAANDARKPEGDSGTTPFTFTIRRSVTTATTVVVNWAVAGYGKSAADAADFAGGAFPSGSVTFAPDETSKDITINVAGDTTIEPDESFGVTISSPGSSLLTVTAVGTILTDDVPVALAIAGIEAKKFEGNTGTTPFTFAVIRARSTSGSTTVTWAVSGSGGFPATPDDFAGNALPSGTIQFAPGETSKTITVLVKGDTAYESDERFSVAIFSPGATITIQSADGIILNDDAKSLLVMAAAAAAAESQGSSSTKPRAR